MRHPHFAFLTDPTCSRIPNGTYQVVLLFSEVFFGVTQDGDRAFDISIEGNLRFNEVNIAELGGNMPLQVITLASQETVTDGSLSISFELGGADQPFISAVKIFTSNAPSPTPLPVAAPVVPPPTGAPVPAPTAPPSPAPVPSPTAPPSSAPVPPPTALPTTAPSSAPTADPIVACFNSGGTGE